MSLLRKVLLHDICYKAYIYVVAVLSPSQTLVLL